MKISRRSLLAGCAGTLTGMMLPGNGIAAAAGKMVKPAIWKLEAESLAASMPIQNPAIIVESASGNTVLTIPDAGRGARDMVLNTSGRMIWDACDGNHTVKQIADRVCRGFDIEMQQAYVDCMAFLLHLKICNAILV